MLLNIPGEDLVQNVCFAHTNNKTTRTNCSRKAREEIIVKNFTPPDIQAIDFTQ